MSGQLLGLGGGWLVWCSLHSLLIWPSCQQRLQRRLGPAARGYRLGYNLVAALTLVPLLVWEHVLASSSLPVWHQPWWLRLGMIAAGCWLLWAGARVYPLKRFLGVEELISPQAPESDQLVTRGILHHVRHPWYLAGLLLLWSRTLTPAALVTALVLSLYLLVGAHLEELKLLRHYGAAYAAYRRQVPMLLPRLRRR